MIRVIPLIVVLISLTQCATLEKSLLFGAATGGAMGSGFGVAAGKNVKSGLFGGAIGAVIGAAFSYLGHRDKEQKEAFLKDGTKEKGGKEKIPSLSAPEVRRIWVPDKIEGNRYEAGHHVYILDRQSEFVKE